MSRKPPDFDLWLQTAKTITPLRQRASRPSLHKSPQPATERVKVSNSPSLPHAPGPSLHHRAPPPITGLDRRTTQRLTRGQVEIERRLDLHGTGIEMARVRLYQFLRESQLMDARTVLVITGKGDSPFSRHTLHGADHFHAPERAGRLRRLVPEWLHEAEFRALVSGFQPAHPSMAGVGHSTSGFAA